MTAISFFVVGRQRGIGHLVGGTAKFSRETPVTSDSFRHRSSPSVLKNSSEGSVQFFKRDACDERFLSSSVVTFGVEKFVGRFRPIFQERRLWRATLSSSAAACGIEHSPKDFVECSIESKCCILYNKNEAISCICGSMLHFVQHFERWVSIWSLSRPNCCTKYNIPLPLTRKIQKMLYFLQDSSPHVPGEGQR